MTCKKFNFILYKKQEICNIVVYIKSAGLPEFSFFFFLNQKILVFTLCTNEMRFLYEIGVK